MSKLKNFSAFTSRCLALFAATGFIASTLTAFAGGNPADGPPPKAAEKAPAQPPEAAPAKPADALQTGTMKGDRVNVRVRPSLSSETIAQLRKGDHVTVLEIKKSTEPAAGAAVEEWMRVTLPDSAKVYVHKNFVKDGAVTAGEVHVRSGASLDHPSLGLLKKGTRVDVGGTKGDWLAIKPPASVSGWVASQYVELTKTEPVIQPRGPEPLIGEKPVTDKPEPKPVEPPPAPPVPPVAMGEAPKEVIMLPGIIRTGTLLKADDAAPPGATHQLYVEGRPGREFTLCYIKWNDPNLDVRRLESKTVRIRGRDIWERGKRFPLMEVDEVRRVW